MAKSSVSGDRRIERRMHFKLRGTHGLQIEYRNLKVIGQGGVGVVYKADAVVRPRTVVIKQMHIVEEDPEDNRELSIMKELDHQNIVKLLHYEHKKIGTEMHLYLILEPMSGDLRDVISGVSKLKCSNRNNTKVIKQLSVKVYMYQVFRALAYLHSVGICHRSIKPENVLVDYLTNSAVKICDFGRSKRLVPGDFNANNNGTLAYRAPEMLYGSNMYTFSVDLWSAGCVLAEMLLLRPIFNGETEAEMRKNFASVVGPPSEKDVMRMNPNCDGKLEIVKAKKDIGTRRRLKLLDEVRYNKLSNQILFGHLLKYAPNSRLSPLGCCAHAFFDELRQQPLVELPNGQPMPPLFNFTAHELGIQPELNDILVPKKTKIGAAKRRQQHSEPRKSSKKPRLER